MASRSAELWKRRAFSLRPEQGRAAIGGAMGLEPFENFLRVVQDGRGRIHRDRRRGSMRASYHPWDS